jgi:hypothetical protein
MPPTEFKPATLAKDRPQTYALDRKAVGMARQLKVYKLNWYHSTRFYNSTKILLWFS